MRMVVISTLCAHKVLLNNTPLILLFQFVHGIRDALTIFCIIVF